MRYLHFNKANGYPYGNLQDPTKTKAFKEERERIRLTMQGNGSFNHIEKTYSPKPPFGKKEDGSFSYPVEHILK